MNPPARMAVIGEKFNRLTVVSQSGQWCTCLCDCGKTTVQRIYTMSRNLVKSCGCFRREGDYAVKHGHERGRRQSSEYRTYNHMIARCHTESDASYHRYGGRGIFVCDRWRESFDNFLADMGNKPSPRHSMERRDNEGPYSPDNCIWATMKEQNRNKRNNHRLLAFGKTVTLAEWAEETGIPYGTLWWRIKSGMTAEKALTMPVGRKL